MNDPYEEVGVDECDFVESDLEPDPYSVMPDPDGSTKEEHNGNETASE